MSGLITGLVLLALGALAAASSIVARRPDAKAYIELMVPYQGWFGFITCLWGAWTIINAIINLNWLGYVPVWWLTYLATGVASMFAIQMFVNVGMVIGIMPITGIPLPFLSYGGTTMLVNFVAVGILLLLSGPGKAAIDKE